MIVQILQAHLATLTGQLRSAVAKVANGSNPMVSPTLLQTEATLRIHTTNARERKGRPKSEKSEKQRGQKLGPKPLIWRKRKLYAE
jgi:hypothetical protein